MTFTESPQLNTKFIWPSASEILGVQKDHSIEGVVGQDGLRRRDAGQVIIPEKAVDLILRLCVVAHSGIAGHQGLSNTAQTLAEHFWWPTLKADAEKFVRECIHCLCTRGGIVTPRPWGEQVHGTKPNEVLHFDFLSLGLSSTGKNTSWC